MNLGSFTLGPTWINPLELSNVAATLASGGKWCPPSPIDSVFDRNGKPVSITQEACQQAVEPGLANTLANAMSKDAIPGGTAAAAAGSVEWTLPMSGKTGTTESHMSSGFLGFTNTLAGAAYVFGDSPTPGQICSAPLRACGSGNLFGGSEPAQTWFQAIDPIVAQYGETALPPIDDAYVQGRDSTPVPSTVGMQQGDATKTLMDAGFQVAAVTVSGTEPKGTVILQGPLGNAIPGSNITISVSDGAKKEALTPTSENPISAPGGGAAEEYLRIPGMAPIPLGPTDEGE
jgi:membrane peptidoglycan carboxypeptidase